MKRLWLIVLSVSLIISGFCIFYVAVGATSDVDEQKEYAFPEEMKVEREALLKYLELNNEWKKEPAKVFSMKDAPLKFSLYAPEYEGGWGVYQIEYTVKRAYTGDTLTEGMNTEKFAERDFYSEGKLREGYTFLFVDVIIENKDTEKQMYLVNSINAGEGLLGFAGQTYRNTAVFHKELYPEAPFETTLVFGIEKDRIKGEQLSINTFGVGTADGNCVYIDLEVEN